MKRLVLGQKLAWLEVYLSKAHALTTLALLAAAACSSNSKTMTTDEFCTTYAARECDRTAALCAVPEATCEAARKPLCTAWVAQMQSAARIFHPDKAGACFDKIKATYELDTIKPSDFAAQSDACNRVFSGDIKMYQACTVDYDCEDDFICSHNVCAKAVPKNSGDQCGEAGSVCASGTYCTSMPTTPTVSQCLPKKASGEPCDTTSVCKEDLHCVSGACASRVKAGEPCGSNDDCPPAAPYCDLSVPPASCSLGLRFASHAPACIPYGFGSAGTGGSGGGGGSGATGGGGGHAGTGGAAGGAGGSAGNTAGAGGAL